MKTEVLNKLMNSFRNSKSYLLINVGGLSIAFAVFILIMLFVKNEFNFDKFNTNGDRVFRIEEGEYNQVPMAVSKLAKQNCQEIENTVVIKAFDNHWISYEKNIFEIQDFCFAENSFFEMFSIPFILGDPKTALEAPYTIVLSESVAKRVFGDRNPLGLQVNFKNEDNYTITGVIKDMPDFHLPAKAIGSFKSVEDRYELPEYNWNWSLVTYVMLVENHNRSEVEIKINNTLNQHELWKEEGGVISLRPFNDIYLASDTEGNDETKHGNMNLLIILMVIGLFIILIASINYINLSISRGIKKINEFSIRRILGSSKGSLIFKSMFNSVKLCAVSVLIAFVIVMLTISYYENLIGKELNIQSFLNLKNILLIGIVTIVLGIIYGFFPSYFLLRINSGGLKNGLHSNKQSGFNVGLITFQYAISIILICGTIITYKQLNFIRTSNIGLNKEQVVSIELTPKMKNKLEGFKTKLLENPNIGGVSYISDDITQLKEYATAITINNERHIFNMAYIDPEFIPLLDIGLLQGENFSENILSQKNEGYIINEAAWKTIQHSTLKEQNYVLGKRSLIGVVKNFYFESLHNQVNPMIFYWGNDKLYNTALVKLTNGNYTQSLDYIKETFKTLAPESLCKYQFVDAAFDDLYQSEKIMVKLLGIFSMLAIFIASLGIISLSSMSAETRTKEIGIRKVNGAKVSEILAMLNRDFIKWVTIAFVAACPIAYYAMTKWLENFAYKTTLSWWIFVLAGMLALGIALLTVSWQSWRAATRNPVEALRYE